MRRPKAIIVIIVLVLCGVLAVVFWPEKPEPVYKGRKLSEWVVNIGTKGMGYSDEYSKAIHAIGTNGMPFYLEWIRYEPGFVQRTKVKLAWKGLDWFHKQYWFPDDAKKYRAFGTSYVLEELGELAAPAIPQLLSVATNSAEWDYRGGRGTSAFTILGRIGRPAVPGYLWLLTNADARVRANAAQLANVYTDTSIVSQVVISLQDPDERVRQNAAHALRAYDGPEGLKLLP